MNNAYASTLQVATIVVVLLAFFGLSVGCSVYKYHDCKKVGHSTLYCVMNLGH
jgi:hypothetical protein